MKLFDFFTLAVAAVISACAAYYSVLGLTAIFSAAFWSIVIMGSVLELAKIVSAVWLHLNWNQARWWIKLYMTPAVAVLMLITSMGIFGFLSRAHIEQNAGTQQAVAQIDRIDDELARFEQSRERALQLIQQLESGSSGANAALQTQIDREQTRVDNAYARVQPAIDEQLAIIDALANNGQLQSAQARLTQLEDRVLEFETALNSSNIEQAQTLLIQWGYLVGSADGKIGARTSAAIQAFRDAVESQQSAIAQQIAAIEQSNAAAVQAARDQVDNIRASVQAQVQPSLDLIAKLSQDLGETNGVDIRTALEEQQAVLRAADEKIQQLSEQRFEIATAVRKLEAEVGPIKYVAELAFGAADSSLLERAVQWMILLLVAVFDPLALVMILAATSRIANAPQAETTVSVSKKKEVKHKVAKNKLLQPTVEKFSTAVAVAKSNSVLPEEQSTVQIEQDAVEPTIVDQSQAMVSNDVDIPDPRLVAARTVSRKQDNPPMDSKLSEFDLETNSNATFGTAWPSNPAAGDLFLKVDTLPNRLYKWSGKRWIETDRSGVDNTLAYNEEYIDWLIGQIRKGHANYQSLGRNEQQQVKARIANSEQ